MKLSISYILRLKSANIFNQNTFKINTRVLENYFCQCDVFTLSPQLIFFFFLFFFFFFLHIQGVYWIMILRNFKRLFYHEKFLWYSIKTLFNLKKVLCYSIKIFCHLKKVLWYSIKTLNHLKKVQWYSKSFKFERMV